MDNKELYNISNEFTITELLSHFDSDIILDIMKDKLDNIKSYSSIPESNIILSFEENFKLMKDQFSGDELNINIVRDRVYKDIISILCDRFNLQFAFDDETIDIFTAAYYAYDFLVCNYNSIMVNFFTSFIINNKDSLYTTLNLDAYKKNKDSSTLYNKKMYADTKYITINANIEKVINYISSIDISISNIFQSTYTNLEVVDMLNNSFADKDNFFKQYYCSILSKPELLPIIITDIRLNMQKIVGDTNAMSISDYMNLNK